VATTGNDYPVQVTAEVPAKSSRGLALTGVLYLKWLLVLPHFIVLFFVGIAAFFVGWIGYWVILFTGRLPDGMHGFLTGYLRWNTRVNAWIFSLTDKYPPFSLGGGSMGSATTAAPAMPPPPPAPPAPTG
jgi:hypothetical protein